MNIRGFAALAKMHRFRMDDHRRRAADLDLERVQMVDKDIELADELVREKAALQPGDLSLADFAAYLKGIEIRREELAVSIAKNTRHLARISEAMAIEFREAKKFELAMERETKRRRHLANKLE